MTRNTQGGRAIRVVREMAGLSIDELAEIAQTDAGYLRNVEDGVVDATPTYASRLMQLMAPSLAAHQHDAREQHVAPLTQP